MPNIIRIRGGSRLAAEIEVSRAAGFHASVLAGYGLFALAIDEARAKIDATKTSRDLTAEGKGKQIASIVSAALNSPDAKALRDQVARAKTRREEVIRAASAPQRPVVRDFQTFFDAFEELFEAREVRAQLGTDSVKIIDAYADAMKTGDAVALRRIAPLLKHVSADERKQFEQTPPEAEQLGHEIERHSHVLDAAKRDLEEAAGFSVAIEKGAA